MILGVEQFFSDSKGYYPCNDDRQDGKSIISLFKTSPAPPFISLRFFKKSKKEVRTKEE